MNYNHNYMNGGVRIEPALETARMRGIIERLTRDVHSKDEIIAKLNNDIAQLQRSSESHLVNNLRAELRAKDQAINVIEARYLQEIEDLRRRLSGANNNDAATAIEARYLQEIEDLRRRLSGANNNDAATISQLRQRIATLDQDKIDLERRHRGELARKQSRIDELEVGNRNLRAANANTNNNRNNATAIADLQAELERTWAELERARGRR